MHEDLEKVYALWGTEQSRDLLLAEWKALNETVKQLKKEQDAQTEAIQHLVQQHEALTAREREANRKIDRYTKRRQKAQQAIDTGTATDFGMALEQVRVCTELTDEEETELLLTLDELDNTEGLTVSARLVNAQLSEKLDAATAVRDERKPSLKVEFDAATTERDAGRQGIWRDLLNRYDRLRAKRLMVFANVVSGQCSGCWVTVPSEVVSAHRRAAEVGVCKNCGRFMGQVT